MTTVINLFGGPGIGKSSVAAVLYGELKTRGFSVELCREYAKYWAYRKHNIGEYDQLYMLGKQSHYESFLYGNVDYIVTDSPVLLAGFYATWNWGEATNYIDYAAQSFVNHSTSNGVTHWNFLLSREVPYDPNGRFESEEDANAIDVGLKYYLAHIDPKFRELPIYSAKGRILDRVYNQKD
jgi:hypothetical protein